MIYLCNRRTIAGQLQGEWQAVDICMGRVVAVIVRVLPSNNARFSAWITTSFCLSGAKTSPKEIFVKLLECHSQSLGL